MIFIASRRRVAINIAKLFPDFFASLYPTVHKTITITFLSTDKRYSVPKTKVVNFMCILLHLLGFLAPLSFYDFATSAWLTHFKNKAASSALFPFKKRSTPF